MKCVGSRMFVAGNIVGFSGPFGREFNRNAETTRSKALVEPDQRRLAGERRSAELLYMTPEEVREEVRKYIGRGIDFLKYGASTHNNLYLQFSPEAQKAIVEESASRRHHRPDAHHQRDEPEARDRRRRRHAAALRRHRPGRDSRCDARSIRERNIYCATLPRTRERLRFELGQNASEYGPAADRRHALQRHPAGAGRRAAAAVDRCRHDGPDAMEQQKPEQARDRLDDAG